MLITFFALNFISSTTMNSKVWYMGQRFQCYLTEMIWDQSLLLSWQELVLFKTDQWTNL